MNAGKFILVKELSLEELKPYLENTDITMHVQSRIDRIAAYKDLENSGIVAGYVIDKGHTNGNEVHIIYHKALIKIYNQNTKKYITPIAARPGQIKRYFGKSPSVYNKVRKEVLHYAWHNVEAGLNNV